MSGKPLSFIFKLLHFCSGILTESFVKPWQLGMTFRRTETNESCVSRTLSSIKFFISEEKHPSSRVSSGSQKQWLRSRTLILDDTIHLEKYCWQILGFKPKHRLSFQILNVVITNVGYFSNIHLINVLWLPFSGIKSCKAWRNTR